MTASRDHRPSRRADLLAALLIGILAGTGAALADLALDCRVPSTEACFWAKHLFFTVLGLSVALVGVPVAALTYAGLRWRHRRSRRDAA